MVSEWTKMCLGDIGEFKNGINKGKKDFGFGTKFVNIQDIYRNPIIEIDKLERVNVSEKEIQNYQLKNGDIIFVRSSVKPEGVGYPGLFDNNNQELVVHSGFTIRFRQNEDMLEPKFMLYTFKSFGFRNRLLSLSTVSANTNINQEALSSLEILIPSKREQVKISEILTLVDNAIEKTKAIIEQSEKVKRGLMHQLLTKGIGHTKFKDTEIGNIPEVWGLKRIAEVAVTTSGGTPSRRNPDFYNGEIPWIKTGELKNKYIYETEEKITEEAIKKSSAKRIPQNTVLIAMYGATIGQTSITKIEATTNQASCAIISDSTKLEYEFLYYFLKFNRANIIALGAGGAQPNISQQIIKDILLPIPPLKEQQKIISIITSFDEKIQFEKSYLDKINIIKKGLMQDLLTGKVRVNANQDEVVTS
jgi:type I restriction enzyme, S subunit